VPLRQAASLPCEQSLALAIAGVLIISLFHPVSGWGRNGRYRDFWQGVGLFRFYADSPSAPSSPGHCPDECCPGVLLSGSLSPRSYVATLSGKTVAPSVLFLTGGRHQSGNIRIEKEGLAVRHRGLGMPDPVFVVPRGPQVRTI
jgi:hypothetical protein